ERHGTSQVRSPTMSGERSLRSPKVSPCNVRRRAHGDGGKTGRIGDTDTEKRQKCGQLVIPGRRGGADSDGSDGLAVDPDDPTRLPAERPVWASYPAVTAHREILRPIDAEEVSRGPARPCRAGCSGSGSA